MVDWRPFWLLLLLTLLLVGCSLSTGGLYMGTGSHPHVTFAVKGTVGPLEVLHAPTTQKGANDLYSAGLYPNFGRDVKASLGAGWAWWRDWDCTKDAYNCSHNWTDGLTAGAGLTYESGHARIDVRYQLFTNAPFDSALLFTIGATP